MALLDVGYWPTTHWPSRYWQADYWPEYGTAVPTPTPTTGGTYATVRRRRRLPDSTLRLIQDYLKMKLEED